jgi:hypothetical protein
MDSQFSNNGQSTSYPHPTKTEPKSHPACLHAQALNDSRCGTTLPSSPGRTLLGGSNVQTVLHSSTDLPYGTLFGKEGQAHNGHSRMFSIRKTWLFLSDRQSVAFSSESVPPPSKGCWSMKSMQPKAWFDRLPFLVRAEWMGIRETPDWRPPGKCSNSALD